MGLSGGDLEDATDTLSGGIWVIAWINREKFDNELLASGRVCVGDWHGDGGDTVCESSAPVDADANAVLLSSSGDHEDENVCVAK
jgi:hypothetical protein